MMSDQPERPSEFVNQFIIYAKHWYGHSGNILKDLQLIMWRLCGEGTSSIRDVWHILGHAAAYALQFDNKYVASEFVLEMLGEKWGKGDMLTRPPEAVIMSHLAILEKQHFDFDKKWEDFSITEKYCDCCDKNLPRSEFENYKNRCDPRTLKSRRDLCDKCMETVYGLDHVPEDGDHSKCCTSSTIHDCISFGQGELDMYGFWERPCYTCAREWEKGHSGEVAWPHSTEYLEQQKEKEAVEV